MSDALDPDDARKCADTFEGTPVGDTPCSLITANDDERDALRGRVAELEAMLAAVLDERDNIADLLDHYRQRPGFAHGSVIGGDTDE